MVLSHVVGLFSHPEQEWKAIHDERTSVTKCYCSHVLFLAALPAIAGFIGTTQVGWQLQLAGNEPQRLTMGSALQIALLTYAAMLFGVFIVGKLIHWMAQTYGSSSTLPQCIALAAYTATPLFLVGLMLIYPQLWINMLIGLPALAYSVYLLYTGIPIMMEISKERGFLFASAVLAVGLVVLVGILATTVILWDIGVGPRFIG